MIDIDLRKTLHFIQRECAPMNFTIVGPFEISRHGQRKLILKESLDDLASELEEKHDGLQDACGCYVFAVRSGGGYTPYYVGQSCRSTILKEAFNSSNREKYNKALNDYAAGVPVIFMIPMLTPQGRYRKKTRGERDLGSVLFLERWLIAKALEKNRDLSTAAKPNSSETFTLLAF